MSLLMEALRKAEAAKNKVEGEDSDDSNDLSLEPQENTALEQAKSPPAKRAAPSSPIPEVQKSEHEPRSNTEIEQVKFELQARPTDETELEKNSDGEEPVIAEAHQTRAEIADELLNEDFSDKSFDLKMESADELDSIISKPEFIKSLDDNSQKTQEETLAALDQKIGGADELSGYIPEDSYHEPSDYKTADNDYEPQEAEEELTEFERSIHRTEEAETKQPLPDQAIIDRQTANSLFQAKQNSQQNKRNRIILLGLLLALLPIGGGGFYWYYSSTMSSPMFPVNASISTPPQGFLGEGPAPADSASQAPASTAPDGSTLISEADETIPEANEALAAVIEEAESNTVVAAPDSIEDSTPSAPDATAAAIASNSDNAVNTGSNQISNNTSGGNAANSAIEIRLTRTTSRPAVNPDLLAAYESYQQGNLEQARRLYAQVLETQANNRDALLGLASINRQEGDIAQAQAMYSRLLQLNPRDPLARAGLLESAQNANASQQELQLRALQNEYPNVAPLAFALGNLFASQSRWNEAQNAYFDALLIANQVDSSSISPDYAFNLAVSLERLNQLELAYNYYQQALDLSSSSPAGFNMDSLNQRMAYLEEVLQ